MREQVGGGGNLHLIGRIGVWRNPRNLEISTRAVTRRWGWGAGQMGVENGRKLSSGNPSHSQSHSTI